MKKLTLVTLLIAFTSILNSQTNIPSEKISLRWQIEYKLPGTETVKSTEAAVPGAIQLDIARAEQYGPHYFAENWKDYLWMEDEFFTYRTSFSNPSKKENERLFFVSKGIDYSFEIFLNEENLLKQEGMFTPVRLDITDLVQAENELSIRIHPVPKSNNIVADRSQANQSVKPAVSYTWDWHPRLIPSGIWDETYLEVLPEAHLVNSYVAYKLNPELNRADIEVDVNGVDLEGNVLKWELFDETGKSVISEKIVAEGNTARIKAELRNPQLWWTHDHGTPYLYESRITLTTPDGSELDTKNQYVGFRQVRLVMNTGGWNEPQGFPKSRSIAPTQFELNGKRIFAKGTNWVNPDIFPGIITAERYNELTDRAIEANFNMLRIWGGGIVNKESFYEQCDEKGIIVWQEFPLACNNYIGTPEYLAVLEQESESIILRLRNHACIGIWSGGNELFNSWSRMTDQSLALRLLNSQCLKLDPGTPYINTSPLVGMGHGHYVFRDMDSGEEVYSTMQRAHFTAYTEFGMPAPSSRVVLEKIIPREELWPPKEGTSWESHHAYKAWVGNTWLMQDMIEDYFGKSKDLDELIENGQLLQVEGYKAIYEEARRQKPYCSMALNWCFNEPWPTAANNSIINYPNLPKPGFYGVRDACRPVLASARITKLQWQEGETFETDLYMLNDSFALLKSGSVSVKIRTKKEDILVMKWDYKEVGENENLAGPTARIVLPYMDTDRFKLVLEVEDQPEFNSEYLLLYSPRWRPGGRTATMNQ
ncbi:glycoside hydrolase family 2 protein [Bacteroidota bacterium]